MSSSHKKYDVFISFRGEDTRAGFTSHLHQALSKENIETYIDYKLKRGDDVGKALAQAISDSHISVVVFSNDYASSKWCLDELLKILQCRKCDGQVVIPVFCEVDPSDVRKQTGTYEKAFAKHERDLINTESYHDKVSQWRGALTEAANISGWDTSTYRDEAEVMEKIVKDVWEKLSRRYPNELKGLVEIDKISEHVESSLEKFPRIGIWGMGGIGKTTIAKAVFAKHFPQYDNVCFLEKVREKIEKLGTAYVRNELLGELLKRPITTTDTIGSTFIQRRLSSRKVFIVLDDVDDAAQFEDLYRELDHLGPYSKLIVTTRNKDAAGGKLDEILEVKEWTFAESLKLFSLQAFGQSHPRDGYERLSERAVTQAAGIPLALKVLGSHLRSRSTKFWDSELTYFENKQMDKIRKVLQASYNGLHEKEQAIFIDIAFFFKGENKDFATRILDACGFGADSGIEILQDKALISISNSNRIQMHDLLQKMGLEIVREENKNPGRRSRLRDIEDIRYILKNNGGTDAVEGIALDLSQRVDLHLQAKTFHMMNNLRFLRLHVPLDKKRSGNVYLPTDVEPFSDKLRYLEWNGYILKSLPPCFCAELLVEIRLPHSSIEELWQGTQELVNLEGIDLSECKHLIKLPDLSGAAKLKWLYLSGCETLCDLEPSTFSKDTLVILLLDRCKNLRKLISEKHLTSLQKINVFDCSSLKEFSLSSDAIERLDLSNTGVEILRPSTGHLGNLMWLNLDGLRLENLPDELSRLRSLNELSISNCDVVTKQKLHVLFSGLQSLQILYLKDCSNLSELPTNIGLLSSLYELRLDGSNLESMPASIKYLSELEILSLENCKKLRSLPELPQHIKEFYADNCVSLATVSTLKTFSAVMNGKEKYISFKNDIQLSGPSVNCINEDALLTMKSAAFHNILVRKFSLQTHSYNYNSAEVRFPGTRVPKQFRYRTTDFSVSIGHHELSFSLGFIFAVVVSASPGSGAKIQCQCYLEDGRKVGYASRWHHKIITDLKSDHVFVWYDPFHSDSILTNGKTTVSFEFSATTNTGERDRLFVMKECGVCPIYYSELSRFLGTMNLDKNLAWEITLELSKELGPKLYEAMQYESEPIEISEGNDVESIERSDQNEGNDIESIERSDEKEGNGGESIDTVDDKEGIASGTQIERSDEKGENSQSGFKTRLGWWLRPLQSRPMQLLLCGSAFLMFTLKMKNSVKSKSISRRDDECN